MKNVTYSKFCVLLVEPCLGRNGILLLILLGLVCWWLLKIGEVGRGGGGVDNLSTTSTVESMNKLGFVVGGFINGGVAERGTGLVKCVCFR